MFGRVVNTSLELKGVFRCQPNRYDKAFFVKVAFAVSMLLAILEKQLHHRYLTGS